LVDWNHPQWDGYHNPRVIQINPAGTKELLRFDNGYMQWLKAGSAANHPDNAGQRNIVIGD